MLCLTRKSVDEVFFLVSEFSIDLRYTVQYKLLKMSQLLHTVNKACSYS